MKKNALFFLILFWCLIPIYAQREDTVVSFSGEWGDIWHKRELFLDTVYADIPQSCKVLVGVVMQLDVDSTDASGYTHGRVSNTVAYAYIIKILELNKYVIYISKIHKRTKYVYKYGDMRAKVVPKKDKRAWMAICAPIDSVLQEIYADRPVKARFSVYDANNHPVWKSNVTKVSTPPELTIFVFPRNERPRACGQNKTEYPYQND